VRESVSPSNYLYLLNVRSSAYQGVFLLKPRALFGFLVKLLASGGEYLIVVGLRQDPSSNDADICLSVPRSEGVCQPVELSVSSEREIISIPRCISLETKGGI
jgi:hypothetical protein